MPVNVNDFNELIGQEPRIKSPDKKFFFLVLMQILIVMRVSGEICYCDACVQVRFLIVMRVSGEISYCDARVQVRWEKRKSTQ